MCDVLIRALIVGVGPWVVITILQTPMIDYIIRPIYEREAYKAIEIFNGKNFNELFDQEDVLQEIKVCPSIQYPGDKQVIILDKQTKEKTILFIENDNGKAKVIDVTINGTQVIFK